MGEDPPRTLEPGTRPWLNLSPGSTGPQLPSGQPQKVVLPSTDRLRTRSELGEQQRSGERFGPDDDDDEALLVEEEGWSDCSNCEGQESYSVEPPQEPLVTEEREAAYLQLPPATPPLQQSAVQVSGLSSGLKPITLSSGSKTTTTTSPEQNSEGGEGEHRPFHQLLVEIAQEHQRALAQLRAEMLCADDADEDVEQATSTLLKASTFAQGGQGCKRVEVSNRMPKKSNTVALRPSFSALELPQASAQGRVSPFDFVTDQDHDILVGKPSRLEHGLSDRMEVLLGLSTQGSVNKKRKGPHHYVKRLVNSQAFDGVSTVAIVLNSILYGMVANSSVSRALSGIDPDSVPVHDQIASLAFSVWFVLELALRICAAGWRNFFNSSDWSWNLFDMVVVGSDVSQLALDSIFPASQPSSDKSSGTMQNFTVIRMLRILRISRAIRVLRLVRIFRELRMMVISILVSGSALLWSLVLLSLTIYVFSIYFIQVFAYDLYLGEGPKTEKGVQDREVLKEMFGDLLRAEYTLYQAVSGGISWGEISGRLIDIHIVHGFVFCFFTFFTTFALLNIITGIFVDTSINSARSRQDELAQEQLRASQGILEEMRKIFEKADEDKSGTISLKEFESYMDRKEVKAYLDALGIEVDKAKGLFELLDLDMSGEITVDEFTFGCLRLKGGAKAIDLATLMNHTKRMADQWRRYFHWSERQFRNSHVFQLKVTERLQILFGSDEDEHSEDERLFSDEPPMMATASARY